MPDILALTPDLPRFSHDKLPCSPIGSAGLAMVFCSFGGQCDR